MYEAVVGVVRMQATLRGSLCPFAPGSLVIM